MGNKSRAKRLDKEISRGGLVEIIFDGKPIQSYKGETIAAALIASGNLTSRIIDGQPMGVYCNMGICHSCIMKVNGINGVRICKTYVSEGCEIKTQRIEKGRQDEDKI